MLLRIFLILSFLYEYYSLKKFTIHSEGKNIITSKVSNQGECKSIAITQGGSFIKYKSDSSIISSEIIEILTTTEETNYFMCQFSDNHIILIRNKEMTKIELDGNGNIINPIQKTSMSDPIISLQCNLGYYIITYLTNANKTYNFKIYSSTSISPKNTFTSTQNSAFISSSCLLIDNSHVLCINALPEKISYYYHLLSSSSVTKISDDIGIYIGNNYGIKGALIKYWSNNEILLCINAYEINPINDINLLCFMVKAEPQINDNIHLDVSSPRYLANEKVTDNIAYCQIEKLTSSPNLYASICLSYYLRTTYFLSIFKYESNQFSEYEYGSYNDYKDINFPLLDYTSLSITSFDNKSFGIFFKDIDNDSMILMFYPSCGNTFDMAPVKGNFEYCENILTSLTDSFYDECTHTFMEIPEIYSIYERNQFCKIKKMQCKSNDYLLDNFGKYECWNKNQPPDTYFFNSTSQTFKKCFRTCLKCEGEGDDKCITCKENFYEVEKEGTGVSTKECHHKDEPLERFYLDSVNKIFRKCRKECLTCNEFGDIPIGEETDQSKDTKCTKCLINEGYYPQVDKPSNCIHKNATNIQYYYHFDDYKSWEKCFDGCLTCTGLGTSIYDTNCNNNSCSEGYAIASDNSNNCFKKDARYDNYFYNSNRQQFENCNEACLQCDKLGNPLNKCLKCKESNNYFPKEDDPTICLKYVINQPDNDLPEKYYYDPNTKTFRKCQEGCLKCREQIYANENDTQCVSCDEVNKYYPLFNEPSNCYSETKEGYYLDKNDNTIKKCPEGCISCEYKSEFVTPLHIRCKKCDNELRFYELEQRDNSGNIINPIYKECRTLRGEKISNDTENNPYNQAPPLNTILSNHTFTISGVSIIVPMFKYCASACTQCTGLYESKLKTHCQGKKCSSQYAYILNYEDICYPKSETLSQYFFNREKNIFMPCYETCETCQKSGTKQNNNCNTCRKGYKFHPYSISHANNCIFDCLVINNYFYLDEDNNDEYTCVDECPEKYPYLQPVKRQCLKTCSDEETLKYSRDWICVSACPEGTKSNIFEECVTVSENCLKSELESNYILNEINEANVNDFIVSYCHDYSFTSRQITVIKNKLEEYEIYIYKNKECIYEFFENTINFPDLSVCFDELKTSFNISENIDLIVMIMNIYNKTSSIRVEYKVFNSKTCQELDLNNCSIKNISTYIDLNKHFSETQIQTAKKLYDKGIIVYNRTDPFFTDICYEFTSDNDRDIILEDRVNDFYQDVSKICENNCKYDADFNEKILKCVCELKGEFLSNNTIEDNEKNLGFGVGPISVEVIKCAKKAFLWDYFKTNIGSYTSLVLILAEIPVILCFIKFGLSHVKIFLIPFLGSSPPKKSLIDKSENEENSKNSNNNINKGVNKEEGEEEIEEIEDINSNNVNNINGDNIYSKFENASNIGKRNIKEEEINNIDKSSKGSNDKNSNDSLLDNQYDYQKKIIKKKNYDIYKDIIDYDDLNDVELFDAITFDKRNFCQFYWDELKRAQPIIYSFIIYTPLNPKYFKILLFIFNTIICFEFNAFFYSKKYISEKYYDFHNNFYWYVEHIYDRIIYTCICTVFLNLFVRVLTNSKKKIQMWIKREKDPEELNKEIIIMTNKMRTNYIVFTIVQGFFMFFFWLYLSCFCNCYKNNEIEWFVSSWICFGLIQIWYFISTFIVSCLRFLGIKFGMESCYNVSLCIAYD